MTAAPMADQTVALRAAHLAGPMVATMVGTLAEHSAVSSAVRWVENSAV